MSILNLLRHTHSACLSVSTWVSCGTTTSTWPWPSSPRSHCSWRTSRATKEPRSSTSEYRHTHSIREEVLNSHQHSPGSLSPRLSRLYVIHHTGAHRDTQRPMTPAEAALVVHSSEQSRTASLELQGLLRAHLVVKSQVSGKVVYSLLKQRYRLLFSSPSIFLHDNPLRNVDYILHRDFLNGWSLKTHRDFRYLLPPCDQISEWFHFPIIPSHSICSKPFVCVSISHWVW